MDIERPSVMASGILELDAALAELQTQGLTVRLHSGQNNTWHIADGGVGVQRLHRKRRRVG